MSKDENTNGPDIEEVLLTRHERERLWYLCTPCELDARIDDPCRDMLRRCKAHIECTEAQLKAKEEENERLRKQSQRAAYLLKIAAKYIEDNCDGEDAIYDGAVCDGGCLAEDCRNVSEDLSNSSNAN